MTLAGFLLGKARPWVMAVAVAVFVGVWFHLGALLIATTNQDRRASDQQANIHLAADSRGDWLPMRTNAVSNPLWAWTAAKLAWDEDEAVFFVRGKWLNLTLSAAALAAGALLLARHLPWVAALNVTLLAGLGGLLPRAVYFQPEPLYYIFFTLACVFGAALMFRNPLPLYAGFGAAAGLAYLAKTGTDLLLLVWFGAGCWRAARWFFDRAERAAGWLGGVWSPGRHVAGLAVAAAVYVLIAAPRFVWSAAHFGDPLFNMPRYWMWQDDYAKESVPLLVNHGHKSKIAALPREEAPSLVNYLRSRPAERVMERLSVGVSAKLTRFLAPEAGKKRKQPPWRYVLWNRGHYLGVLAFALAGLYVAARLRGVVFTPGDGAAGLFVAGVFGIYTLGFGWYDPIGRGDRFMMTLYAPLVLAFCWGIEAMRKRIRHPAADAFVALLHAGVFAALLWNVAGLLARPVFVPDQPL